MTLWLEVSITWGAELKGFKQQEGWETLPYGKTQPHGADRSGPFGGDWVLTAKYSQSPQLFPKRSGEQASPFYVLRTSKPMLPSMSWHEQLSLVAMIWMSQGPEQQELLICVGYKPHRLYFDKEAQKDSGRQCEDYGKTNFILLFETEQSRLSSHSLCNWKLVWNSWSSASFKCWDCRQVHPGPAYLGFVVVWTQGLELLPEPLTCRSYRAVYATTPGRDIFFSYSSFETKVHFQPRLASNTP